MNKKVLILSGSPRKGGNSDLLCDEFLRGAREAGHSVEKIRVAEKKIAPCSACYHCRSHGGTCTHRDDMAELLQKMIDADVLVLASPHKEGCTHTALTAVADALAAEGIDPQMFWIGTKPLSGCIACKTCVQKHLCVFDDKVNEFLNLAGDLEVLAKARTPVYLAIGEDDSYYGSGSLKDAYAKPCELYEAQGVRAREVLRLDW